MYESCAFLYQRTGDIDKALDFHVNVNKLYYCFLIKLLFQIKKIFLNKLISEIENVSSFNNKFGINFFFYYLNLFKL